MEQYHKACIRSGRVGSILFVVQGSTSVGGRKFCYLIGLTSAMCIGNLELSNLRVLNKF